MKASSKLHRLLTGELLDPHRVELFTSLSPAECVVRLTAVIDAERTPYFSLANILGVMAAAGHVTETSLYLRKRVGYRHPSRRYLLATMRPEAGGTLISGEVVVNPVARLSFYVVIGGVLLFGGALFLKSVRSLLFDPGSHPMNGWMGAVMPPAVLAFLLGLARTGSQLARNEARFLTDFLIETLNARPHEHSA
jgi:hypothetical protein